MSDIATLVILADGRVVFSGAGITAEQAALVAEDIKAWMGDPAKVLVLRGPVNVIDLRKHL